LDDFFFEDAAGITVTPMSYDSGGNVSYGYSIDGADLDEPTTINLYWATGPTRDSVIGGPISSESTATTQGKHALTLSASALGDHPPEANYLVAVVDPDDDDPSKVTSLALPLPPTIALVFSQDSATMDESYTVTAQIENPNPFAITVDLHWAEQFPLSPVVRGQPGAGDVKAITLPVGQTPTKVDIGTFKHPFDWLPGSDPDPGSAAEDVYKEILGELLKKGPPILGAAFNLSEWVEKLTGLIVATEGPGPGIAARIDYKVELDSAITGPVDSEKDFVVTVPLLKKLDLFTYFSAEGVAQVLNAVGSLLLGTGQYIDAVPFFVWELDSLLLGQYARREAADPPDPDYTALNIPSLRDLPELDALPDGPWKELGEMSRQLLALETAEATARDRADGAAAAGDLSWESTQLIAASGFASAAADLYSRLRSLDETLVEPYIQQVVVPNGAEAIPYLESHELPDVVVRELSAAGWSAAGIEALRQSMIPDETSDFATPGLLSNAFSTLALVSAYQANDEMSRAIQIRVDSMGQPVGHLSAQDRASLTAEQSAINTGLASGVASDAVFSSISGYLSHVFALIASTNNPVELQPDLDFAHQALASAQLLHPADAPVTSAGPTLDRIDDQSAVVGSPVRVTAVAVPSTPTTLLTYALAPGSPNGASIDPHTGVLTWIPTAPGTYSLTVLVSDNSSPPLGDSETFAVTVSDVAPVVSLGSNARTTQGAVFDRIGSISSPIGGTFSLRVDYGDGTSVQQVAVSSSRTFTLSHVYASPGSFTVSVYAIDAYGTVGGQTLLVAVAPKVVPQRPRVGIGRDAFVTTLYTNYLGRLPEPSGLRYWTGLLSRGVRPENVARYIWNSREHRILVNQHPIPPSGP
jgi:hypothetical protein